MDSPRAVLWILPILLPTPPGVTADEHAAWVRVLEVEGMIVRMTGACVYNQLPSRDRQGAVFVTKFG